MKVFEQLSCNLWWARDSLEHLNFVYSRNKPTRGLSLQKIPSFKQSFPPINDHWRLVWLRDDHLVGRHALFKVPQIMGLPGCVNSPRYQFAVIPISALRRQRTA